MHNFVTVIFDDNGKAYQGLHALWQLDQSGEVTVHGTAVVHRNGMGQIEIDTKDTSPVLATAVGAGVGALLGLLAGPVGVAIGIAEGAAVGAAAGAVVGGVVDIDRLETREQAFVESGFVLGQGQSAVIADVSEDRTSDVDQRMHSLGGVVHRRSRTSVRDESKLHNGFDTYAYNLYPYEYVPERYSGLVAW